MTTSLIQPSFAGGEVSPSLYGRVDLEKYQTSLRRCRNFIVRQYGGRERAMWRLQSFPIASVV